MPQVKCSICAKDFYAKPNWLKRGWGRFCSHGCKSEGQKNGKFVECFTCKRSIYKTKKELRVSKSKKYFCTKTCQTLWRNSIYVGGNHSNWKGGEHVEYRKRLLRSGLEQYCRVCGTDDKRILCVHHIDKSRKNNAMANLTWLCHNCHYLVHHYGVMVAKEAKNMVPIA